MNEKMTETNLSKKPERPVFHISIPILFLMGFFITVMIAMSLEDLLHPTVDNWRGITDPVFNAIFSIISAIILGCILDAFFTGWFYLRAYRCELTVSRKALEVLFSIGGVISALGMMFFAMFIGRYIDVLERWRINPEVINYLCLMPIFLPPLLWSEIWFRVAKKINGNQR